MEASRRVTMLLALVGLACVGKSTVADYLVATHGFTLITLGKVTSAGALHFTDADEMLHFVTSHWQTRYVTRDLYTSAVLEMFEKRPFFLLVGIEAPLLLRWARTQARSIELQGLEAFVAHDDRVLYGTVKGEHRDDAQDTCAASERSNVSFLQQNGALVSASLPARDSALAGLLFRCQVRIANTFETRQALHTHLDTLNLTSMHRLRPAWDTYFVSLCSLASLRSNCMKRRVGAVIVRNNRVLSTGYNGTPRGLTNCNEGGCARCNESASCGSHLDECLCLHAEENALLELGRDRGGAQGTIIYCNTYVALLTQMSLPSLCGQDRADRRNRSGLPTGIQHGRTQCTDLCRGGCPVPQVPPAVLMARSAFVIKQRRCAGGGVVVEKGADDGAGDDRTDQPRIVGHHDQHQETSNRYLYTIDHGPYTAESLGRLQRDGAGVSGTTYRMCKTSASGTDARFKLADALSPARSDAVSPARSEYVMGIRRRALAGRGRGWEPAPSSRRAWGTDWRISSRTIATSKRRTTHFKYSYATLMTNRSSAVATNALGERMCHAGCTMHTSVVYEFQLIIIRQPASAASGGGMLCPVWPSDIEATTPPPAQLAPRGRCRGHFWPR